MEFEKHKDRTIAGRWHKSGGGEKERGAFTLVELLVVIAVISILMSIVTPALSKARRRARAIRGMSNQRQIVLAVGSFAADNDGLYPDSVATIGRLDGHWNWHEPMKLLGHQARSPRMYRSASAYLRSYLEDPDNVYCPNAPRRYEHFDQAWAEGDKWDNPDTPMRDDPLTGTYCFYWNYTGYLKDRGTLFQGPRGPLGGANQSTLLVSCFFGYDQYLSRGKYGSCEEFGKADFTEGSYEWPSYWSGGDTSGSAPPDAKLHAGYNDGHIESYSSAETAVMSVIRYPETSEPYPSWLGPGDFHVPQSALP